MGEFFRGWRRKMGLVTLVMACVFAGGWVRSLNIQDEITIPFGPFGSIWALLSNECFLITWSMSSNDEALGWEAGPLPHYERLDFDWPTLTEAEQERVEADAKDVATRDAKRTVIPDWLTDAFRWGSLERVSDGVGGTLIPYWSVVIPFTLLSAWLLLIKPRPAKPDAIQNAASN